MWANPKRKMRRRPAGCEYSFIRPSDGFSRMDAVEVGKRPVLCGDPPRHHPSFHLRPETPISRFHIAEREEDATSKRAGKRPCHPTSKLTNGECASQHPHREPWSLVGLGAVVPKRIIVWNHRIGTSARPIARDLTQPSVPSKVTRLVSASLTAASGWCPQTPASPSAPQMLVVSI